MKTFILIVVTAVMVATCCSQLPHAIDHALGIPEEVHHADD